MSTTSFVENNVDDATNGSTEYFANRHYPVNNAALCHRSLSTDNKYVLKRPPMQHQQHVEQNTSASPSPRKIKVKMASELKKSESLRKMSRRYAAVGSSSSNETPPPPPQPPPSDAPLSKFKSKSYLINSKTGGSGPNDSISSSLNLKRLLFSSSSNSHHHTTIAPHHSTISGVKTKKLASNVNLLQSNFQTCFFNSAAAASSGGKKKRSSLFNLFSFKNNSTPTPSTTTQGSSPSPARHTSSTSPSPSPPTQQQTPYQSYEASIRDSIAMIEAASTDDSSDLYSNGYDERSVYHHRQHHRQSLAPDHTMFINQMMPAKEELTESIRRLERAHSELKRPLISTPTQDEFEDNRREDLTNRSLPKKAPSIRSKGFSIPLNASYCLNSIPINCLHHQYIYHRPTITYYHPTSLEETISAGHETNSTSSSRHQSQHLFKDYEEIKAEEENLLLAQKKSFDLEEENSCLKEVNMRLRFAQVKNVYNSTDTNNFPVKINNNSNNNSSSNQYRYEPESSLNNHQNHTSTNNNEYSDDDENQIIYDNYAEEDSEREVEDENEGKHHHHHHQYQYSRKKTTTTTTTNNEVELEGDEEEAVAAATAASLSPTSSSLLTLSINSTTNNNNSLTTATNNNEKLVYHYHQQQQQQHHQHHQQHPQQLLRCNNQLNEQNMFGNQHQLLLLNESKLPSTTAVNKEDMEKLNINNNSECKQETNNSKKKRFQQFQTRSLINLNAQLKKSFQQQQTNSSGGEISSATASPTMDQLPIWQQQQQQQHQMIKPIMVISKAPSIRINHSDDNCYESNSIRLIYTYLKEQLANNSSSLPHIDSQWVKIVNGSKLRDLLKPVLDDHGLNLDDYEVFSKTSNDEQHLLVDMDSNSDDLSPSTELFLRCKTQQQTLSQPQQPQQQQQQQQIAKKEDDSSSTSTSATSTSTTSSLSSPSAQNKEENTTNKEQSQTQTQSQATTTSSTTTTTSTPQQAQRKTTTARVLVSANSSSHLLTPNQPSYKVRKSSLQMPPPVESLIQTSLSHYNALSTQQGVDALGIVNSPTSAAVAAAAAKQSNSSISSSSVNWQSYFNTKISKDKLTSKQKRNSCIAVMSEFSTSPISPLAPQSQQIVVSNATTTTTTSTNLRDSIGSFQSYVQSTSASSMLASATATITKDPNSSGSNKDSISGVRGKKNFKQIAQLSSIFTSTSNQSKNIEQTRLMEKLNSFMKELPKLPDELNVKALDMSILEIEPDWCKYVGESFAQSLPVRLAKQQMAIWELLSTECSHIKTIKVIIDVFLCCLINLKCSEQTSELFKDIDTKKIFCNIADVFNCNLTFWTKYLHPIVLNSATSNNSSSTSKNIIDPLLLVNAFADFKCLFAPYEEFILERNNSTDYFKQKLNENENFLKFINWAENHPLVGRLKIADFMMIPVQRLTKYQLLIENIYQHTDDESRREKIAQIKEIVNGLPNTINIKLNYIAQFNDISDSIERYEGISGPTDEVSELLNAFKLFDIKSPLPGCSSHTSIRELIFQGPLKLKEASKSACDVYCFLFTDMLLITQLKKASKKYRIIKPPVPTNRMLVKELTQTDKAFVVFSLNDYNVPDSVNMFISNFSRKWVEYLELSKKKYIMELEKSRTNEANSIILRSLKSFNFEAANQQPPQPPQPHDDYYPEMENEPPLSPTTPVSTPLIPTSPLESPLNIEPPRRDSSSATLTSTTTSTPNTSNVGSPILENVITSSLEATTDPTSPPAVSQPAPRPYQKRMDRQRRNMTDPTQHHNGNPLPASVVNTANDAASIVKRNSLNDAANRRRGELEEENMKAANRGDSTSTILSTDSGVSCFDLESISIGVGAHRPVKGAVTTVQQSTIKLNVLSPSSSPSSSSSYSSSSPSTSPSNFVTSSSSSSDKPTSSSSSSSEANCGYDMVRLAHQEENDDEDYYNDDDLIIDSSASIDPNRNGSTESSNNNNNESKTINNNAGAMNEDIYNNSNGVNNNAASDLNRQLMFRKQNNIRVKQSNDQNLPKHLRNLKQQQQQQNTTTNNHQFDMNNNQTNEFYDYNGVTPTSNNTNTNTNNSSQRKPMIKIKSTTLKNESVRIQANEISNNSTPANFDTTVNSAHSNTSNPDDDSHQRMMLVNLIHATMDATEV